MALLAGKQANDKLFSSIFYAVFNNIEMRSKKNPLKKLTRSTREVMMAIR